MSAIRPNFDVCGPLPTGTTVLEASAGTGKTFTIAALAARYVAEGHAELSQLMLVTFGRMATNELRMRVRDRLVSVERHLAAARAGRPLDGASEDGPGDDVAQLLTRAEPSELAARHRRVARALAEFDAATIATTHEFCLRMLDGLGVLGDREPNAVFVEHLIELTREVAGDVYLQRYATRPAGAPFTFEQALWIARDAVNTVHARLVPAPNSEREAETRRDALDPEEPDDTPPPEPSESAERVTFGAEVRREVQRRKELGRLFTYDDMLTRLRDALADPIHGPAAAARLRARYRVVLVDEFQDTDPVQWDILRRGFHTHTTLILIGDPKQAIYAFRGADVFSYLDAVHEATSVATLGTNWRSDRAVTEALDTLLGGAALGDADIVVRGVGADHQDRRLDAGTDAALGAPIRLRIIEHDRDLERVPSVATLRPRIVTDLVADVTALLDSPVRLRLGGAPRRPGPADIAVLVRRNERGEAIRDALVVAGVPAVLLGATSVFDSAVAAEWLTLLTALEQPRQAKVRDAALTCFCGWTFAQLAAADDNALTALSQRMRWWSGVLSSRGVAALVETMTGDTRVSERLLAQVGGERELTDLRHIGQNLHHAMVSGQLGVGALVEWLRAQISEARTNGATEGSRRLETDAAAVHILTVHRSKGLEFPIVYLPEAWDQYVNAKDDGRTLRLHESSHPGAGPGAPGRAVGVLDVGGLTGPGRADRLRQQRYEDSSEELRLLYVALTRAQLQVVTWWAPSKNTPSSALHRFLYGPRREGVEPAQRYELEGDPFGCGHLGEGFSLERVSARPPVNRHASDKSRPPLSSRTFDRELDLRWRRTSYSALTAAVHGLDLSVAGVGSEPETPKEDDETALAGPATGVIDDSADPLLLMASPMGDLPSGVQFGTAVHAILETIDPQVADLSTALRQASAVQLGRSQPGPMSVEALAAGLQPSLETPLGPLADQLRLCDIPAADRLPELDFEIPLAGGETTTTTLALGQLAPVLRRHLPPGDPLIDYPDRLEHPALADESLRGYLSGSIDAVLRVRSGDGVPRYLVVDYKTNWLGGFDGQILTVGDYTPTKLAAAMMAAHYPLQALLYGVAVHRMLRWRQPGYEPDRHLGGVLYLFIRGMAGAETPRVDHVPCGVFSWRPPGQLIADLSDLLDRGAP